MTLRLNRSALDHAEKLIRNRQCVLDEQGQWSDHRPSRTAEKHFFAEHGVAEFQKWFLGEDDERRLDDRRRYRFAYGDFSKLHRCGVLAARARAARVEHADIERAAAQLCAMLDALAAPAGPGPMRGAWA
jgi:hypothetical protein